MLIGPGPYETYGKRLSYTPDALTTMRQMDRALLTSLFVMTMGMGYTAFTASTTGKIPINHLWFAFNISVVFCSIMCYRAEKVMRVMSERLINNQTYRS